MDLYAFSLSQHPQIANYITINYGEVPRLRGVRFMKLEEKTNEEFEEAQVFNKYVGTDTIYIHTRCGDCDLGYDDEDSNYMACGGKEWEEKNKDKFLEHITEDFDSTYCTHYFKAVDNAEYQEIIKELSDDEE